MTSRELLSETKREWLHKTRLEWYKIMQPFGTWLPAGLQERVPSLEPPTTDAYLMPAPGLDTVHVQNCRVVPNRLALLTDCLPPNSICCEVGTGKGRFSRKILELSNPRELHLIDLSFKDFPHIEFAAASGTVIFHEFDSIIALTRLPDRYFDWIYFDCNHNGDGPSRHLEVAKHKIKPTGMLAFNGYIFWSHKEFMCYGVMQAVNEFCLKEKWEMSCLALHNEGYNDVVIRKRQVALEQ